MDSPVPPPQQPPQAPPPLPPQFANMQPPAPLPPQKKPRVWLWVVIGGGAFFAFLVAVFLIVYSSVKQDNANDGSFGGFGQKIAVVDIDGVIIEPRTVVKQLKKYGDDDSIKAIILHMDTPGGGVAASQEIYSEVKRVRTEKKKLVVTSIETVGASGGYYIASASD